MRPLCELRLLIDRYCTGGRSTAALPKIALLRSDAATSAVPVLYQPVLCIVAQGSRQVILGQKSFTYDVGSYLVASADLAVHAAILGASPQVPFLSFGLLLDPVMIASLLVEMKEAGNVMNAPGSAAMATYPIEESLLEAVVRLMRLLERPEDIPILARLTEREILYHLLKGPQGSMLKQWVGEGTRLNEMSKVIAWIRRNYAKPFHIGVLAEMVNMSAASLHRNFKTVTQMSPLQYQKQTRLQEARRLLLDKPGDAASVGFSVGYGSSTQFSR